MMSLNHGIDVALEWPLWRRLLLGVIVFFGFFLLAQGLFLNPAQSENEALVQQAQTLKMALKNKQQQLAMMQPTADENKTFQEILHHPIEALENYPLSTLSYVGMIADSDQRWGLVLTPTGEIVPVKVGHYLGQHFGRVMAITEQALVIQEAITVEGRGVHLQTIHVPLSTAKSEVL